MKHKGALKTNFKRVGFMLKNKTYLSVASQDKHFPNAEENVFYFLQNLLNQTVCIIWIMKEKKF